METVAIIGASNKPNRYANQAQKELTEHGHLVIPITARGEEIMGVHSYTSVAEIDKPLDTVTLYVREQILEHHIDAIIQAKPGRVIFNPGTESPTMQKQLENAGIEVEEACTLVLLSTGQY